MRLTSELAVWEKLLAASSFEEMKLLVAQEILLQLEQHHLDHALWDLGEPNSAMEETIVRLQETVSTLQGGQHG